jgi:hypothetical protein
VFVFLSFFSWFSSSSLYPSALCKTAAADMETVPVFLVVLYAILVILVLFLSSTKHIYYHPSISLLMLHAYFREYSHYSSPSKIWPQSRFSPQLTNTPHHIHKELT